jgi:hypothetical protein
MSLERLAMAKRKKILGLPIGPRRGSSVPKVVVAGAAVAAVPAIVVPVVRKVGRLLHPGRQLVEAGQRVADKATDAGTRVAGKVTHEGRPVADKATDTGQTVLGKSTGLVGKASPAKRTAKTPEPPADKGAAPHN